MGPLEHKDTEDSSKKQMVCLITLYSIMCKDAVIFLQAHVLPYNTPISTLTYNFDIRQANSQ